MPNTAVLSDKTKGILCIISSAFFFALMGVFVRLSGDVPSMQKVFFRNLVAIFLAAGMLLRDRTPVRMDTRARAALAARAVLGTIGVICNFYAVDHLVLADATMLNKIGPIFAILFSFLLLGERIAPYQALAVAVTFAGCLLIIKPTGDGAALFPMLVAFAGGVSAGGASTMLRLLGRYGVKKSLIVFVFSLVSLLTAAPFLIFDFHPMTGYQLAMLLLAGASAAMGQFSVTNAYAFAPAREISVFDYSQVVFSAAMGFFVFGQVPDTLSLLGYLVVCGAAVYMFLRGRRAA